MAVLLSPQGERYETNDEDEVRNLTLGHGYTRLDAPAESSGAAEAPADPDAPMVPSTPDAPHEPPVPTGPDAPELSPAPEPHTPAVTGDGGSDS